MSGDMPWDRGDVVVTEDNVMFSQLRYDAIQAVKNKTATPEQVALVQEADAKLKEAMELRRSNQ